MEDTVNTVHLAQLFLKYHPEASIERAKATADVIARLDGPGHNGDLCNLAEALQYEIYGGIDANISTWPYGDTAAYRRMVSIQQEANREAL